MTPPRFFRVVACFATVMAFVMGGLAFYALFCSVPFGAAILAAVAVINVLAARTFSAWSRLS